MNRSGARFRVTSRIPDVLRATERAKAAFYTEVAQVGHTDIVHETPVDLGYLRATIAYATPDPRVHQASGPDGPVTYQVQAPPNTVQWGSNAEYAAAVHEGVQAQQATVPQHRVRSHTRRQAGRRVAVREHTRGPHTMSVPARAGTKFIERPLAQNHERYIRAGAAKMRRVMEDA